MDSYNNKKKRILMMKQVRKLAGIHKILVTCLFSLLLYTQPATAQNKLDSIHALDEVVITKPNIPKEIIPVQSLSSKELEKLSAHSVADALRYFSGVQIKDYGGVGGFKTVNIRSLGSEHVGVFYDGIEIGNAQNGVVDLGRFSLDNMDIISLYNGQRSAIFQSAKDFASASSIYMTTKTPVFKDKKKYNLKAILKAGSFDFINPGILWEQKISDKVSSSLNADFIYSSGKYKFRERIKNSYDTTMVRQNGDIDAFRLEHALSGSIKDGEWKTKTYFYSSERGLPGAVVKKEPGRFQNKGRQWDKNFFFQTSIKKRFSKKYTTEFRGKYAYDYMRYLADPQKDEQEVIYVNNKYRLQEAYFSSANMLYILPFWNINISADYQWNTLGSNVRSFIHPKRHTGWTAVATSLYFDKVKMQASLLGTFVNETFMQGTNYDEGLQIYKKFEKVKNNWDEYMPSFIISYQPWLQHDFHIRAFYKKIFRLPTFNEIFYAIIGSGISRLRPEYPTQYNLGITYSKTFNRSFISYINGQVDAYYNEIKDKIVAIPTSSSFRWTMMNLGLVKIKGIETSATTGLQWGRELSTDIRLTYTYQKALDYTTPELGADGKHDTTYKGQIPYIPEHSGSIVIGTNYKTWGLNYSFIYSGERYTSSENSPYYFIPAWYTHDLSLTKSFNWHTYNFRLTAEVNNLFNQQYDIVLNHPMPGTNFKIIASVIF